MPVVAIGALAGIGAAAAGATALGAVAVGGLAASAYGTYQQGRSAKELGKITAASGAAQQAAMNRQFEAEQRRADIQNARSVRSAVRQARIARAAVVNAGANANTLTSSGVAGGVSSIGAQLEGNLTDFSALNRENQAVLASQREQGDIAIQTGIATGNLKADAAQTQAVADIAGSIFNVVGGGKTIFS